MLAATLRPCTRSPRTPARESIGHDAAADGKLPPAAAGSDRADQDVQVHRAVEAEIAQRAAIGAAGGRLQFGDDLHRADLRRPGDRTAGKCRPQQVDRRAVVAQPAADRRDQMQDVLDRPRCRRVGRRGRFAGGRRGRDRFASDRRSSRFRRDLSRWPAARLGGAVEVGSPVRGRVPLIGRVSTSRSATRRNRSGEALTI